MLQFLSHAMLMHVTQAASDKAPAKSLAARLLNHGLTMLCAAGGATALLAHWALQMDSPVLVGAGVGALLLAAGIAASRYVLYGERWRADSEAAQQAQAQQATRAALDALATALQDDGDERTLPWLHRLLAIRRRLDGLQTADVSPAHLSSISSLRALVEAGIGALKQNLQLHQQINERSGEVGIDALRQERRELLDELAVSVAHLEDAWKRLQGMLGTRTSGAVDLTNLRQQLDEDLQQAARVSERLNEMEQEVSAIKPSGLVDPEVAQRQSAALLGIAASADGLMSVLDDDSDQDGAEQGTAAKDSYARRDDGLLADGEFERWLADRSPSDTPS